MAEFSFPEENSAPIPSPLRLFSELGSFALAPNFRRRVLGPCTRKKGSEWPMKGD